MSSGSILRESYVLPIITPQLEVREVGDLDEPEDFLPLFNTNPGWIEASELHAGKRQYDISDAAMYLWQNTAMEHSRCLVVHHHPSGTLIGTAALIAPHPSEPRPWIGLLLIHSGWQRQGLGTQTLESIQSLLADEGWDEVRVSVLKATPGARRFFEHNGYTLVDERDDQNKRPCWILERRVRD